MASNDLNLADYDNVAYAGYVRPGDIYIFDLNRDPEETLLVTAVNFSSSHKMVTITVRNTKGQSSRRKHRSATPVHNIYQGTELSVLRRKRGE